MFYLYQHYILERMFAHQYHFVSSDTLNDPPVLYFQ